MPDQEALPALPVTGVGSTPGSVSGAISREEHPSLEQPLGTTADETLASAAGTQESSTAGSRSPVSAAKANTRVQDVRRKSNGNRADRSSSLDSSSKTRRRKTPTRSDPSWQLDENALQRFQV